MAMKRMLGLEGISGFSDTEQADIKITIESKVKIFGFMKYNYFKRKRVPFTR